MNITAFVFFYGYFLRSRNQVLKQQNACSISRGISIAFDSTVCVICIYCWHLKYISPGKTDNTIQMSTAIVEYWYMPCKLEGCCQNNSSRDVSCKGYNVPPCPGRSCLANVEDDDCVKSTDYYIHCKNGERFSGPQPGCHLPNSPWQGITQIFPARESLVSD